jgi:hypothetical protein
MFLMPRPPKSDRSAIKNTILAIRLSPDERAMFDRLVQARAEELARLAGQPIDVTAASYIRWLILRDGEARGMVVGAGKPQDVPPNEVKTPANAGTTPRAKPAKTTKVGPKRG